MPETGQDTGPYGLYYRAVGINYYRCAVLWRFFLALLLGCNKSPEQKWYTRYDTWYWYQVPGNRYHTYSRKSSARAQILFVQVCVRRQLAEQINSKTCPNCDPAFKLYRSRIGGMRRRGEHINTLHHAKCSGSSAINRLGANASTKSRRSQVKARARCGHMLVHRGRRKLWYPVENF